MSTATAKDVADIIGIVGEIVGKTKLQKTIALLQLAGLGPKFSYSYYLYGPYSEELSATVDRGVLLGIIHEDEKTAAWGGRYSVYRAEKPEKVDVATSELVNIANKSNSVTLELAVTAAFLSAQKEEAPWDLLAELKPEKTSTENMDKARALYEKFKQIETPNPLPNI